jgi:hypothetical protein
MASSIFDLKQSAAELPSLNQGTAKLTYQQVPPTRDVTGTNFPNGSMHFRWETSGVRWWIPSRSYIRMRCNFYKADGVTQPTNEDDIAPNMGMMGALFQSGEFRMADKTVSRVSDFMAQVDALEKRLGKSKSWLDGVGKDLERWDPSFQNRQNDITSDGVIGNIQNFRTRTRVQAGFNVATTMAVVAATGVATFAAGGVDILNSPGILNEGDIIGTALGGDYTAGERYLVKSILTTTTALVERLDAAIADRAANLAGIDIIIDLQSDDESSRRSGVELIWQPPLSVFKLPHGLPSGKYELILTPQTTAVYQKRAIESLNADEDAPADFQFVVDDMYLVLSTVEGPVVDNISYFMSLEETRCQTEAVDNNNGLQQKNFDVSPTAYALTAAYQHQNLQDTRNSASKFKFAPVAGVPSGELNLQRFYMQYNGENKPSPDADPNYSSPDGFINSRYAESLLYSGAYFDCGGGESRNDWINRGLYMYFSYPKDGSSESTRVNVNYQFRAAPGANAANLLLFDHYKKMVLVSVQNGRIVDLIEQDA